MIEPADAVLANSSRMTGASSRAGVAAEQPLRDQLVHRQVGLMQPEAAHAGRRETSAAR